MKFYVTGIGMLVLGFMFAGCTPNAIENSESTVKTESTALDANDHYVRVVLPEADKSPGTTVTINMPPRKPYIYQFPDDLDTTNPDDRLHVFNLEAPLQPATMTVDYNNGESHTMSQVIFDTTIETP